MLKVDRKTKNRIKKFAEYRGKDVLGINYETLLKAYSVANQELRNLFEEEMQEYFNAVKAKDIKKGQSILHVYDSASEGNNTDSK